MTWSFNIPTAIPTKLPFENLVFMDTEFHATSDRFYNDLYCCSIVFYGKMHSFNFLQDPQKAGEELRQFISSLPTKLTLVSFNLDAEIRFLNTLYGEDRIALKLFTNFICLYREYLNLGNRNPEFTHGEVLSHKMKTTRKFKPSQKSENTEDRKYMNLLNALYKLLGIHSPTHMAAKNNLTRLCASGDRKELILQQDALVSYCEDDTRNLPALLQKMWNYYREHFPETDPQTLKEQILFRGLYAEMITYKIQKGYYLDIPKLMCLMGNVPFILRDIALNILERWPQYVTFEWKGEAGRFVFKKEAVFEYLKKKPKLRKLFGETPGGDISLSTEFFEKIFPNKHSLKEDDYLQQVYKYLYTRNSLIGLSPQAQTDPSKRPKFGNYFCRKDGLIRPRFNDFGSQTSRNQPAANGYLLLKPAWTRVLLIPPPDHCMIVSDISREEVLILAILSQDKRMLDDFAKGDIYVQFGLRNGGLKESMRGTEEWSVMRHVFKAVVLSIMYGKGAHALAATLKEDTGRNYTPFQAKALIDSFWREYPHAYRWINQYLNLYKRDKKASLPSGWTMWGNNYNERSVKNFPVQGHGAEVMRAVDYFIDKVENIWSPLSLHDGFFIYSPLVDGKVNLDDAYKLTDCIHKGFHHALNYAPGVELVRNDLKIIAKDTEGLPPQLQYKNLGIKINYAQEYIDERAVKDLKLYRKYFTPFIQGEQNG